jgi:hypothetical protein
VLWSACYPLAACSGVVERRPRVRPAAIRARDLARVPCAAPSSAPSASWCSGLSRPLSGPRGCKRARTPGRHQVAAKQRARLGCARGSAPTGPAVKTSNPRLSPRDADRAVGGIRTWAQNSGRRASCPSTVLLSGALCELTLQAVKTRRPESNRCGRLSGRQDGAFWVKPCVSGFSVLPGALWCCRNSRVWGRSAGRWLWQLIAAYCRSGYQAYNGLWSEIVARGSGSHRLGLRSLSITSRPRAMTIRDTGAPTGLCARWRLVTPQVGRSRGCSSRLRPGRSSSNGGAFRPTR